MLCAMATHRIELLDSGWITLHAWRRVTPERPFWRLYWAADPGAWIAHHDQRLALEPGIVAAIPPHTAIERACVGPVRMLHAHCLFGHPADRCQPGMQTIPVDPVLRALLRERTRGPAQFAPSQRPDVGERHAWLSLICAVVARCTLPVFPGDPAVEAACEFIELHFPLPCTNEALAQRTGLSRNQFIRRFRSACGTTPQAWQRERRLDRVATRLEHEDVSIDTIADDCGFSDRAHLDKRFRERYGCTPAAYRQATRPV